jgi:alpha-mannosidase
MYEPEFYRMPLFDGMRDSGAHKFCLALYPFDGPWQDAGVTQQAWSYNAPLAAVPDCEAGDACGIALDATGTMISSIKRAEDGDALVVRLYEYAGRGETVNLTLPPVFTTARFVNLLERGGEPAGPASGTLSVDMRPFKLVTVRLER